jgi:hypothetical protein
MEGKKEMEEAIKIMRELISTSSPFISGDVVDEIGRTIPLMKRLENTIEKAEKLLGELEK